MSVNKVILVGNVGKDPEIKYFDNDNVKANFPLATSERGYTAANGTQVPERTEWHNIVCWRGLAQIVEKFVKKGMQLYIEGKISTRSYEKDGETKYFTEIIANEMKFLGRKAEGSSQGEARVAAVAEPEMPPIDLSPEPADDLPF